MFGGPGRTIRTALLHLVLGATFGARIADTLDTSTIEASLLRGALAIGGTRSAGLTTRGFAGPISAGLATQASPLTRRIHRARRTWNPPGALAGLRDIALATLGSRLARARDTGVILAALPCRASTILQTSATSFPSIRFTNPVTTGFFALPQLAQFVLLAALALLPCTTILCALLDDIAFTARLAWNTLTGFAAILTTRQIQATPTIRRTGSTTLPTIRLAKPIATALFHRVGGDVLIWRRLLCLRIALL